MTIGFIGLGNMGAPMAMNLARAGHTVMGYDVSAQIPAPIITANALEHLASNASTIITMLPSGPILREVMDTVLPHAQAGALFIDCSTVDVETARHVASDVNAAGHDVLDAPVSGGTGGAAAGTLTFMVGGTDTAFARAAPIFEAMGSKVFHCGQSGSGQAAKICNNMILGVTMITTCEAFALADGLNLDRQALYEVVAASSGQSWSMTTYCPAPGIGPTSPADNDYTPGFASDLMLKDLTLGQQAAADASVSTELGEHARALYERFVASGGSGRDFSAIFEQLSPVKR